MLIQKSRVLLIGGSGAIGGAMTEVLRSHGAYVVPVGRRWPHGISTSGVRADITLPNDRAMLLDVMRRESINVVVMAAGLSCFHPVENMPTQEVDDVMRVKLIAPMQLSSEILPYLLAQAQTQLVFVGSVLGHMGLPGYATYGASKWGLRGFAQALRREVSGTALQVKYFSPRATRTDFNSPLAQAYNEQTNTKSDSALVVANELVQLLKSRSAERIIGWPERIGVWINACWPSFMDGILKKHAQILKSLSTTSPKKGAV